MGPEIGDRQAQDLGDGLARQDAGLVPVQDLACVRSAAADAPGEARNRHILVQKNPFYLFTAHLHLLSPSLFLVFNTTPVSSQTNDNSYL